MDKAKSYNRIKIALQIISLILNFIYLLILAFTPVSRTLEGIIYSYTSNDYLAFIIFLLMIGLIGLIYSLPLDFYSSFVIEHKYKLSNQKFSDWVIEKIKSTIVSSIILFSNSNSLLLLA